MDSLTGVILALAALARWIALVLLATVGLAHLIERIAQLFT